ncbi:TIR domain-containing protein [Arthrobacter sp. MMS24-S77]
MSETHAGYELLRALDTSQLELLDTIWTHMVHATKSDWAKDRPEDIWPEWRTVSHSFWVSHQSLDAFDVLASLPKIQRPNNAVGQGCGLVWRSEWPNDRPLPTERVGLSIAGLHQLAVNGIRSPNLPNSLVGAIGSMARRSIAQANQGEYSTTVPLEALVEYLVPPLQDRPYPMPVTALAQLLQKEYAPLSIVDSKGTWYATLDVEYLRGYRELSNAEQYINHISQLARQDDKKLDREPQLQPSGTEIFIVHGHDDALKNEVARFLESRVQNKVTILHEQKNKGRTTTEKFEDHAAQAAFAVVLLTPDDRGGPAEGATNPRARQNVVFELGYFFGKLGRNRVAAIMKGNIEQPSDVSGVLYINHGNNWKIELLDELDGLDGIILKG